MTGALTYGQRQGQYTKIGRLVTIQCRIQVATFTSSALGIEISGLPFSSGSSTTQTGFGGAYFTFGNLFSDSTDASYRWHSPLNQLKLQLRGGPTSTTGIAVNAAGIDYTKAFILSGSYYTD